MTPTFRVSFRATDFLPGYGPPPGGETAIVVNENKFYILNGDWRDSLKEKDLKGCLSIYKANPESWSEWSDLLEE